MKKIKVKESQMVLLTKSDFEEISENRRDGTAPLILDEDQTHLLKVVLSGLYDSVKIGYRNGRPDSLEMVKSQDTGRKIVEVLCESDFQDVSIVRHGGKVTRIVNTIKHRFRRNKQAG